MDYTTQFKKSAKKKMDRKLPLQNGKLSKDESVDYSAYISVAPQPVVHPEGEEEHKNKVLFLFHNYSR